MTVDEPLIRCLSQVLAPRDSTRRPPVISLPNARNPRMFLPVERRMAAVRTLARRFGGRSLRRRVETAALSGAILSGASPHLPLWRTELACGRASDGFHEWLSGVIGEPYRVSLVFVGPKRANRKPVVFVTDLDDELIAVVKLGFNEVTRPLVRYEASALASVASALAGHAHIPLLIGAGRIGDLEAMVMHPLPSFSEGRQVGRDELVAVVRAISASGERPRSGLSSVLGHPRMRPLADVVPMIDRATEHAAAGAVHGDFHSGNIGVAGDGRPVVWDWERWADGIPLGFDLLHYKLQFWIAREGVERSAAAKRLIETAPDLLAPLGISPALAPAVACDYLVRLAARYIGDAQDQAGSRLGDVENWLFPVVLRAHEAERHS